MSPGAGVRRVRAAVRSLALGFSIALVTTSCGTSVQVGLPDEAGAVGGPRVSESPAPTSTPVPTTTPTEGPTAPPEATATPAPTPTARPQLGYDEAIDAFFADVERFWSGPAGDELGIDFTEVRERIRYDPADADSIPSCDGELGILEIYERNAFYCEPDDYIAWDDVNLFPELYRVFGDISVGLVIAHEYGHAVQTRAGITGPTIFLELQADCMAGAWAASVTGGEAATLTFARTDLDDAIGGFLTFADPLGTPAADPGAHGTAFDRLNAFAEGFEIGVRACPAFVTDPPPTATILLDRRDENEGNLPLDALLPLLTDDLSAFFDGLGEELIGPGFDGPTALVELEAGGPEPACDVAAVTADIAGSVFFCEVDGGVYGDRAELDEVWSEVGDFAPAYAVAHSFAMAVVVELVDDADRAVLAADCLVGVWSRDIFDDARREPAARVHEIALSAGDLDEGIVGLLLVEPTGPSLAQVVSVGTFDRVAAFGQGFFRNTTACDLA